MISTRAVRFCSLLLVGVSLVVFAGGRKASSQGSQCCTVPETETSAAVASQRIYTTISAFEMTISNTGATNFNGRSVQETYGSEGSNSCYYPGSVLSQHPTVTNPINGAGPWVVGRLYTDANTYTTGPTNHWGYDFDGVAKGVVDQTRHDAPGNNITLPCSLIFYQNMTIDCDTGTTTYETDNTLTNIINTNTVTNCRRAVLDSVNRCETIFN
jgi:hypothetical protein